MEKILLIFIVKMEEKKKGGLDVVSVIGAVACGILLVLMLIRSTRQQQAYQRQVAAALGVSQALLSHYENGVREPGLAFITRACAYYGVSADYLLGLSDCRCSLPVSEEELAQLRASLESGLALLRSADARREHEK